MIASTISTTQPSTSHSIDHQNVRISHVRCDSTHVPRASPRVMYATMTPTMPMMRQQRRADEHAVTDDAADRGEPNSM